MLLAISMGAKLGIAFGLILSLILLGRFIGKKNKGKKKRRR
jgi:hypothetical protein